MENKLPDPIQVGESEGGYEFDEQVKKKPGRKKKVVEQEVQNAPTNEEVEVNSPPVQNIEKAEHKEEQDIIQEAPQIPESPQSPPSSPALTLEYQVSEEFIRELVSKKIEEIKRADVPTSNGARRNVSASGGKKKDRYSMGKSGIHNPKPQFNKRTGMFIIDPSKPVNKIG